MIPEIARCVGGLAFGAGAYWVTAQIEPCRPWSDLVVVVTLATIAITCWLKSRTR